MHRTAAELRQITDPLRRRTEAKEAARQAYAELDALIQRAGPDGLHADDQRRFDALEREHRELTDLADDAVDELIGKIADAAGPVPMPAVAQVRDGKVVFPGSTGEVRFGRPLPQARSLSDLPRHGGGSVEEAGAWLRSKLEDIVDTRALGEASGVAGGFTVPQPLAATIIDLARKSTQVLNAGAQVVPMDSDTLKMATVATDPTPTWRGENVAVPETDPTFGQVEFNAKTLAILCRASWELVQDSPNMEALLTGLLAQAIAMELDRASLYGSGTGEVPRGLRNVAGIPVTFLGAADGAAPTNWDFLGRSIQRIRIRNYVPTGVILAPRTEGDLSLLKDTTNQPLQAPAYVSAVPRHETNQVPTNLTRGTSTDTSETIAGDFSKLLIGTRVGLSVVPLRERFADSMQVGFLAYLRADVQVGRVDAFDVVGGIRPVV